MGFRIGVDIGGTFTDFTVIDEAGNTLLWKEETTPDDPTRAITTGLDALAEQLGTDKRELLTETDFFVHGTTIATNTVIERSGAKLGLLCTHGFRDVLYLRDGFKPQRFNIHLRHPEDLVERYLRFGVRERIGPGGNVLAPLVEEDVRRAAGAFAEANVEAIAIAFLWSILNPEHELQAARILKHELPSVAVLCSSDVLPELGEWVRTSATALGAYTLPRLAGYLRQFEATITTAGFTRQPLVMQTNGGCATVSDILKRPILALASGPAAAPAAALHHARTLESRDLICIDMGGTSLEVCLIRDGQAAMSRELRVADQPIGVPAVELHSVGAGGGSIAWVDNGGALRVGPQSAGAVPGPACYANGGTQPTVTDANVVLGYLAPSAFLGGRRPLDAELAAAVLEQAVARPLDLPLMEAARGVIIVVNSNMVSAIRAVSLERGIDPRGFDLVAGGGAGGLHAAALARALGIRRVLIPPEAGTLCAFGMTVTDVLTDHARTRHGLTSRLTPEQVESIYSELEDAASDQLRKQGFTDDSITLERWVDARYPGQVHEVTVPVSNNATSAGIIAQIERTFHTEHERLYTYKRDDLPIELLHWRVTGRGLTPPPHPHPAGNGTAQAGQANNSRLIQLSEGPTYADIYDAQVLMVGQRIVGPAIVEAATTTILVPPGAELRVAPDGTFVIDLAETS